MDAAKDGKGQGVSSATGVAASVTAADCESGENAERDPKWSEELKKDCEEEEDDDDDEQGIADEEDDVALYGSEPEREGVGQDSDCEQPVQSLFGPELFETAGAFWKHAASVHGFSLAKLQRSMGSSGEESSWTDYHRIRLVNHLRMVGPEVALQKALSLTAESAIWTDDGLLSALSGDGDDRLLFEDANDED